MIDSLILEQKLQKHFQKNIRIVLNEKVIRIGKFILFAPKEYYLVFCISANTFAFRMMETPTGLLFDYKVELLTDDITLKIKVDEYFKLYKSKFLNNKLAFHFF